MGAFLQEDRSSQLYSRCKNTVAAFRIGCRSLLAGEIGRARANHRLQAGSYIGCDEIVVCADASERRPYRPTGVVSRK
jgi:hypothetical protein